MELSGRLQELQNEVNCMNDSRDFRDAESICSGNSHVTSPPGLFPIHPPFEGLLKPAFISQRQIEEPPNIWDTSGTSGNVFCTSTSFFVSSLSSRIEFHLEENYRRTNSHVYSREKWNTRKRTRSEMPVRTVSQRFSHLQWRRLSKELWADQQRLQISVLHIDKFCTPATFACYRGFYLFTISYGSNAMDQRSGVG